MMIAFAIEHAALRLQFAPTPPPGPFTPHAGAAGPFDVLLTNTVAPGEATILEVLATVRAARAEAIAAAKKRMPKQLAALKAASDTVDAAAREVQEATAAVAHAQLGHDAAIKAARHPGTTRAVLEAAKKRLDDGNGWQRSAVNRHAAALREAREASVAAWGAETAERRVIATEHAATAAERIKGLLAKAVHTALEAAPLLLSIVGDGTDEILN
jgi:hypothetical protein